MDLDDDSNMVDSAITVLLKISAHFYLR